MSMEISQTKLIDIFKKIEILENHVYGFIYNHGIDNGPQLDIIRGNFELLKNTIAGKDNANN